MASARPTYNAPTYLQNGPNGAATGPTPGATPLLPNNGRIIQNGPIRILCVADVRGNLRSLNELAKKAGADYIIHTGDFGFYDEHSLDRIADKTLRHVAQYSPLLNEQTRKLILASMPGQQPLKQRLSAEQLPLSELPYFLNKTYTLDVPVYTVWGACEDVRVLEKFRSGEYKIDKLHILDEVNSRLLDVGGVKLRLLGLGGAVVMHKLFDNGEGRTTIAGGQGTMWTTLLQMGELVDTANRAYDPSETRVFVTHASPAREGMLNQIAVSLKADFSISAGLHFRYGSSYNEFSVNPSLDHYRGKLAASKASFNDVWETVKNEVQPAVSQSQAQQIMLDNALDIVQKMPSTANGANPFGGPVGGQNAAQTGQVDESAFKNMWNFNLADAAFGYLVLEIESGRIGTEMRAQGFNFSHRTGKGGPNAPAATASPALSNSGIHAPGPQARQSPANSFNQNTGPRPAQQRAPANAPAGPGAAPSPAPDSTKSPAPGAGPKTDAPKGGDKSAEAGRNGVAEKAPPKPSSPIEKTSKGLYVTGIPSEQALKELFPEAERAKIQRTEGRGESGTAYWFVHFNSNEDAKSALDSLPTERKTRGQGRGQPHVSWLEERRGAHGSRWPSSTRGGSTAAAGAGGAPGSAQAGQGYKSGASDSEGGARGRGRGGRGGRGGLSERGSERGRGGRGGRGSFKGEAAAGSASTPTTEKPATVPEKSES